jgi:hypothetical protein
MIAIKIIILKKAFDIFVESMFWLAIFASPFLLSITIGILLFISNGKLLWLLILISIVGFCTGIFLAERIRRKYSCTNYMSKIFS